MQQTVFRLLMTFNCPVGENMKNLKAPLAQVRRHQDAAMAVERFLFGAHESNAHFRRTANDAVNAGVERWRARNQGVVRPVVDITFALRSPCAEFVTEKHVGNVVFLWGALERLTVEVRVVLDRKG